MKTRTNKVREFIESHGSRQEFILIMCKALASIPVDVFGTLKYTNAHVTLARIQYLEDREKESLVSLGILWDISKLFSNYSLIKTSREDAFNELIDAFNLTKPTQADLTPILSFDSTYPDYSETALQYMKNTVEYMGFYNLTFTSLYNILRGYLTQ